jgi:hypothetical protein
VAEKFPATINDNVASFPTVAAAVLAIVAPVTFKPALLAPNLAIILLSPAKPEPNVPED